ncbi:MAG: Ammonia transporter, partial [Cyanobacteriota bacterium]|nr:Ammonia transporter [Cyanobacteriota bacterium]
AYAVVTIVASLLLWSIIGAFFGGIRVDAEEETVGLDIGEHGMEAYPDFAAAAK